MKDKTATSIMHQEIENKHLIRSGYSKEDTQVLEAIKDDVFTKDTLKLYLEHCIHHKNNEIFNLKENNRLLENGNKQLCEEIKLLIKDKEELQKELGRYRGDHVYIGKPPF